jgi:hypothetical protein
MNRMLWLPISFSLASSLLPLDARACPDCAQGIRDRVRAGIFDATFSRNVAAALLPFAVLGAITAGIGLGGRRRHG